MNEVEQQHPLGLVISRQDAKAAGLIRYFTGDPCVNGHVAERQVSNTRCVECNRLKAIQRRATDPKRIHKLAEAEAVKAPYQDKIITRKMAREAGVKRYFTGLACKNGHFSDRLVSDFSCVQCTREKAEKERAANPERARARVAKSYQKHIEARRAKAREQMNAKYAANPEAFREKRRQKMSNDPMAAFTHRLRQLVRAAIARSGFRKAKKTERLLGCTLAEFSAHIERQFLPGMGWHNRHLWEIDHIVPMSSAASIEDAEALNRATNLRPLWREDNRTKAAKSTHLI